MAGMIPRSFIDDLLNRSDIVDLIDGRVKLKKAGQNYQACCPFHNEKSPSFTVSQSKQFYHCFGCGAHGNAIGFLMEYDNLEFVDAIEELAALKGLTVPREQGGAAPTPKQVGDVNLYELMNKVNRFYQHQLRTHEQSAVVIDYLKNRGLSGETVKKYEIGFAPESWDAVRSTFGINKNADDALFATGMLTENEQKRRYDRFRDRVMFPIKDRRGRVIGFGGRVLGEGTPKYLNSPETPLFHKSNELYALYQVRQDYKSKPPQLLVVEGYMDVVSLAQHGIDYAVAALGTATTSEHIQQLFRTSEKVICCYDGDRAGREAAWRALENALPQLKDGCELKFMFLPDGEDPDTMVQKEGKAGFEHLMAQALPLSDFLFERLQAQVDMGSDVGLSKLASLAEPLITQIPDGFYRQLILDQLRHKLRWDPVKLARFFQPKKQAQQVKQTVKMTPIRRCIALLVQYPQIAAALPDMSHLHALEMPGIKLMLELIKTAAAIPNVTTANLLERWRGEPESAALNKLALWQNPMDLAGAENELYDTLFRFSEELIEQRYNRLLAKDAQKGLTTAERKELSLILTEMKK